MPSLDDALLAHTTPLTWEHIGFSGDFLWDRAATTASNWTTKVKRSSSLSTRLQIVGMVHHLLSQGGW
jgi:hypothetical protein